MPDTTNQDEGAEMDNTKAELRDEVERLRDLVLACTRWLTLIEQGKAQPADLSAFLDSLPDWLLPTQKETVTFGPGNSVTLLVPLRTERMSDEDRALVSSLVDAFQSRAGEAPPVPERDDGEQ